MENTYNQKPQAARLMGGVAIQLTVNTISSAYLYTDFMQLDKMRINM